MRPKKVILCVDDNETTLSVRTFLLETRGYRVINATTSREALEILEATGQGKLDLVKRAKMLHPLLPALIVSGTVTAQDRALAGDAFLPKGAQSPLELLDKIKVLVARKRGPKKHVAPVLPEAVPVGEMVQHRKAG